MNKLGKISRHRNELPFDNLRYRGFNRYAVLNEFNLFRRLFISIQFAVVTPKISGGY